MIPIRTLISLLVSLLLLIGGSAVSFGAYTQRNAAVRGWVDSGTQQGAALPYRLPLPGVNIELRQYDSTRLNAELDKIAAAGFVWVRQTFDWAVIEPTQGQFNFDQYDALVKAVAAHPPLRLVAVLDNSPAWARRADASDRISAPPSSMAAFGTFAGKVAARYAEQIEMYQVWDEPNLITHWGGLDPVPADYAAMLKAAYDAIRGNDPTSSVIVAALAPTVETGPRNISDVLYLRALYDLGAKDSFDAAAGKPYGFYTGPLDRSVKPDVLNFSRIIVLREEMVKHGDGEKPLWGSYFGWNSLPADWKSRSSIWGQVNAETQRNYTRDAYTRAEREWPWIGGLILQHWQPDAPADDPIQGFAVAQKAGEWFENGAFFARPILSYGLHHPDDTSAVPIVAIVSTPPAQNNTPTPQPETVTGPKLIVTAPNVNVREGDGTNFPLLAAMKKDDSAVIIGSNSARTWWLIKHDQLQGWLINDKYTSTSLYNIEGDTTDVLIVKSPSPPTAASGSITSRLKFTGDWRFGPLGADVQHKGTQDALPDGSEHTLTFEFEGQSLGLLLRRADYAAYIYAKVDGQAANALPLAADGSGYIMLKSPDLNNRVDLIQVAKDLPPGKHRAELRFYLGYDRWVLAGIGIGAPPDTRSADLQIAGGLIAAVLGAMGSLFTARRLIPRLPSGIGAQLLAYLRRMGDVIAGLLVSLLALLGMVITWNGALPEIVKRDAPTIALTVLTAGTAYYSRIFVLTALAVIVLWILIFNRPFVGLALVVFWSPFFVAPVQLYIWAMPMVELCFLLTLSAMIVRGLVHWKPQRPSLGLLRNLTLMDWGLLAFAAVATLALLWSEQRAPALREWRTVIIEPVVFYFLIRAARLSKQDTVRLVDVFVFVGTLVACMGLFNYISSFFVSDPTQLTGVTIAENGARRLAGVYGSYASPNNLALMLGRCIPFAAALLLLAPDRTRKIAAGIALALMGIAVILTQSGGAIVLGLPVATMCILLFWDRRGKVLAGAILIGIVLLIPLASFIPRLQNILDLTRSTSFSRTQVWSSTFNLLREHPLTGAGLDQFLYLYRSRYILPDAWREPNLSHPHNFVLDYWVRLGILGLPILLALQLAFWRTALAARKRWLAQNALLVAVVVGAMGSMADFLAHGLVDNSYFLVDLAFIFCFTLAAVHRLSRLPTEETSSPPLNA